MWKAASHIEELKFKYWTSLATRPLLTKFHHIKKCENQRREIVTLIIKKCNKEIWHCLQKIIMFFGWKDVTDTCAELCIKIQ